MRTYGSEARGSFRLGISICWHASFSAISFIRPPDDMQITSAPLLAASCIIAIDSEVLPETLFTMTSDLLFTWLGIDMVFRTSDWILECDCRTVSIISQLVPEPPIPHWIIEL